MTQPILSHAYDNGLVLVAEPMMSLESAAFTFMVPAGCALDPDDRMGLGSLTCEMALRGSGKRDSRQFIQDLENLGIERSFQAMADADLTLVVVDLSLPLGDEDRDLIARAQRQGRSLLAGNKSDLPRRAEIAERLIEVSALTGAGIEALRAAIAPESEQETGFITSLRQEQLLRESLSHA